jgi:hypothetical protein
MDPLRRTIRRCTALLLVVLGVVAVDVARMAGYGIGEPFGMAVFLGALAYLVVSGLIQAAESGAPDGTDDPRKSARGGGETIDGGRPAEGGGSDDGDGAG